MAHAFTLLGVDHEVWLARADTTYRLQIGDQSLAVVLSPRGDHAHELILHDNSHRVFLARRGDDIHVHLDGDTYLLRYSHSLARFADQSIDEGEAVSRAPMPGSVIAVSVEPGDTVQRGQALLVIESMKMETTINASCDGIVQALHVGLGQTFERDAPLVTLERGIPAP
jgi:acetyl/propionyl-CoA carboxylase alpha subunit